MLVKNSCDLAFLARFGLFLKTACIVRVARKHGIESHSTCASNHRVYSTSNYCFSALRNVNFPRPCYSHLYRARVSSRKYISIDFLVIYNAHWQQSAQDYQLSFQFEQLASYDGRGMFMFIKQDTLLSE